MDDRGPERPPTDPPDPPAPPERRGGLILETCYRHPSRTTGVHCTRCGRPICPDCMHEAPVGYQCPECVREARRSFGRRRARLVLGRPATVVTTLIGLNLAMFVVELLAGGGPQSLFWGPGTKTLLDLGAMQAEAVARHDQYWRLVTVMFLHAGLIHIAFNMYALYLFGYLVDRAFGSLWFLAIYFVAGTLASITSFAFSGDNVCGVSVGASGAVFGLLGSWVAYNYRRRGSALASANLQTAIGLIVINLILGFSIANIDNSAHIGGLIAGIAAGTFSEGFGRGRTRALTRALGFAALIALGLVVLAWRVGTVPAVRCIRVG